MSIMSLLFFSISAFAVIFVFFLVIARTLGSINNYLSKVEYWASQELEYKSEQIEIQKALSADSTPDK